MYPQIGGSRVPASSINAAQACEPAPDIIVRYRPRSYDKPSDCDKSSGATTAAGFHALSESFFQSRSDADEFALCLVLRGEAAPETISIYENTGAYVAVSVQSHPRPAAIR
ncbi:MAG TPA: hypothetical protein VH083_23975 [Myxococcales bacterium]|jgi:hypothetical protein|nr:hypothetical protein [Myxococcales bacterium]